MPDEFPPTLILLLAALGLPIALILWNEFSSSSSTKLSLPIVGDVEVPADLVAQVRGTPEKGESLIDLIASGNWARHWAGSICAKDVPAEERERCISRISRYIASKVVNQFA